MTGTTQKRNVIQGEALWGVGRNIAFTTILGSCVAACIRDPILGLGGMNHFLLPGSGGSRVCHERYGEHLMEKLLAGLLKEGACRDRLEAKLFGGSCSSNLSSDIGMRNATFATEFLRKNGIDYRGGDLGGTRGRRIEYWPHSGQARRFLMDKAEMTEAPLVPASTTQLARGTFSFANRLHPGDKSISVE